MKLNCIIVEDQIPAQRILSRFIEQYGNLELTKTFGSALEVEEYLKENKVDLIFLDIHLPKISGVEFIKGLENPPAVILTTAFSNYAIEGYEIGVVDYLLKPFSYERFKLAVEKVLRQKLPVETPIFIKSGHDYHKILPKDIMYIQSDMDYTELHLENQKIVSPNTLTHWQNELKEYSLVRVHRSYLINLSAVDKVVKNKIIMNSSVEIPIGRAFKESFLSEYLKVKS